jgi:hypothetical protein
MTTAADQVREALDIEAPAPAEEPNELPAEEPVVHRLGKNPLNRPWAGLVPAEED